MTNKVIDLSCDSNSCDLLNATLQTPYWLMANNLTWRGMEILHVMEMKLRSSYTKRCKHIRME